MARTPHPSSSHAAKEREHVSIIDPDAGKRYKLHIRGPVHKLTVGKVKRCLAAASSCPIPEDDMLLKLNGVPLSDDRDVCGALGILSGATLTVEEGGRRSSQQQRQQQRQQGGQNERRGYRADPAHTHYPKSSHGGPADATEGEDERNDRALDDLGSLVSPQRRLLELQTLQEQQHFIRTDNRIRDAALRRSLSRAEDDLDRARSAKRQLERQKQAAEDELRAFGEREAEAAREKARLAAIQAEEEARARERAADLAARREQLRNEQDQVRRLAQLKLDNEKRKALLASQRQAHEEERRRASLTLRALEEEDKHKQLSLRAKEIDMEHQRLSYIRGQRELLEERLQALEEKETMYARMGVELPMELLREREALDADAAAIAATEGRQPQHRQLVGDREQWPPSNGTARSVPRITAPHATTSNCTTLHTNDGHPGIPGPSGSANRLRQQHEPTLSTAHHPSVASLEQQQQQQQQNHPLQRVPSVSPTASPSQNPLTVPSLPDGCYYDPAENAVENLRRLGDDLGLSEPLTFDEANTCVISVDGEYTLLVTYDAATERLFLYSTLLTAIPGGKGWSGVPGGPTATPSDEAAAAAFRLKLYEYLLEGSLLGRDMCGGGIGASLKDDFILMSTSIYMPTSQPWALRTVAPQFLQCLQHWRERVADFVESYSASHRILGSSSGGPPIGNEAPLFRAASAAPAPLAAPRPPSQHPARAGSLLFSREDFLRQQPVSYSTGIPQQHQQHQQQSKSGYREAPVMGLEVVDTLVVDGVPTQYHDGVLVVRVAGPAALAGVQPHDVLTAVDGARVRSVADFQRIAGHLTVGQVMSLQLMRGGVPMVAALQVGSVPVAV